jgi:hypothetical protein
LNRCARRPRSILFSRTFITGATGPLRNYILWHRYGAGEKFDNELWRYGWLLLGFILARGVRVRGCCVSIHYAILLRKLHRQLPAQVFKSRVPINNALCRREENREAPSRANIFGGGNIVLFQQAWLTASNPKYMRKHTHTMRMEVNIIFYIIINETYFAIFNAEVQYYIDGATFQKL